MSFLTLPLAYLGWHYTLALKDFWVNAGNLLRFLYHFFSLPLLVKTFFSPWRRLGETYRSGFAPGAWLETLILNTLLRLVGMFIRFWLILFGCLVYLAALVLALAVFVFWLILPLAVAVLLVAGFNLLWA